MKDFIKVCLPICLIMILFSSCISINTIRSGNSSTFLPDIVRLDLTTNNMELLGETDISVKYSQYLFFFRIIELINEKEVSARNINSMKIYGRRSQPLSPVLNRALYDVYVEYPEADFIVTAYVIEEQQNLFLGKKITKSARIKVYKIRI